jgi:pimeloyl-ACP methyl ester carboxylesterase
MEQEIRTVDVDGRHVAYAACGDGPPLVVGPRWVFRLDEEWADVDVRSFYLDLARTHTVVRFDRIGTGLSSREIEPSLSIEDESRQLEAVIRALGGPAVIFATSCCGAAASQLAVRAPELVSGLVYFGGFASRADIPAATRESLVEFTRVNWGLAAQLFAGLFDPGASGEEILRYTRLQRSSARAEAAAALLELDLGADIRDVLPHVHTPALVLHRRGDRTVPISRGRELAALLPNARFVPLSGESHLPWRGRPPGAGPRARGLPPGRHADDARGRLAAHRARDRDPAPRRHRHVEPRDRRDARPQRAHRPPARREHPAQAVGVDAGKRGDARSPRRHPVALATVDAWPVSSYARWRRAFGHRRVSSRRCAAST